MEPSDETYEDLKENIAWNVRVRRKARELKQGELAELADTSVTTICQIENGNAKNMTLVVLCNIAKALDIDFTTLISPFTAHGYGEIDSKSCKNLSENDAIQRIRQTEIQKTYYPPLNRYHEISSMLELALILPLIDLAELYDICQRIKGDAIGFEDYISSLFDHSWRIVPESPEKRAVQKRLDEIRALRRGKPYPEHEYIDDDYDALADLLETKREQMAALRGIIKNNRLFRDSQAKE